MSMEEVFFAVSGSSLAIMCAIISWVLVKLLNSVEGLNIKMAVLIERVEIDGRRITQLEIERRKCLSHPQNME